MGVRKKKGRFFITLSLVIFFIAGFFVGGYFLLDKAIVPKYFGDYGIHSMGDLVGMVKTLYSSPNESNLVKNGFSALDTKNAEDKLKNIFPVLEDTSELDYSAISNGVVKDNLQFPITIQFSDKELAGVLNKMLEGDILSKKLPTLDYISTIGINVLELVIEPETLAEGFNPDSAKVHAIFKVNTTNVREQMAAELGINMFLLNMIIPDVLYLTVDYNLELADDGWVYNDGNISVNGRTSKQSEILLNLLIGFIFPEEEEMNLEKLTSSFGDIMQTGLDILGQAEYIENGIIVTINE